MTIRQLRSILVLALILAIRFVEVPAQGRNDNFFSLEGRFRIALPRTYAEFRPTTIEASKRLLFVMLYKWNTTSGLLGAGYAVTGIDLEDPKFATKVFRDVKETFVKQYDAKLLTEHNRVFDNHQGFEFIIENKSLLTAVRIILVKNRFYMLTLTNRPDQRDLVANGEGLLSTFRLMTLDEVLATRARSISTLPDSPYSQAVSGTDTRADSKNENLKGHVKQVFVEQEILFNGVSFDERRPDLLKDFNEDGYITRAVTFSGQWPATISLYGFGKGSRVFKKMLMSELTWRLGRAPNLNIEGEVMHTVRQKYDPAGRLIEQGVYEENGSLEERVDYKYENDRREIQTRKYSKLFDDKFETHSKTIERFDASGNPIELTVFQYSEAPGGSTTVMNVPVNPHDRVSGAITSGPVNSSSVKNPSNPTAPVRSGISSDPLSSGSKTRVEETKVVTVSKTQTRVGEQKFVYTYEFDSQGNWIKRITTTKDKDKTPVDVTYRTITYY